MPRTKPRNKTKNKNQRYERILDRDHNHILEEEKKKRRNPSNLDVNKE